MRRSRGLRIIRRGLLTIIVAVLIAITAWWVRQALYQGPPQPIPFSHRLHVTSKQLQCFFCHNTAANSANAGMPPVEKCLLCHNVIAVNFQPISRIHSYRNNNQPIPWVRVNYLPDHVHFLHEPHVGTRKFDCSVCHGNIKAMDRVRSSARFSMGFCVNCHKKYAGPIQCFTCHY